MKRCTHCKQEKNESDFHKSRDRYDGLNNKCKGCASEMAKVDRARHREKRYASFKAWAQRNGDRVRANAAERRVRCRAKMIASHARIRAKRKGLSYDLDDHLGELQSRIDLARCELTGLPLNLNASKSAWDSPSLDRIVPANGYVYRNVRIICHGMNNALGNWGEEILMKMIDAWTAIASSPRRQRTSSARSLKSRKRGS